MKNPSLNVIQKLERPSEENIHFTPSYLNMYFVTQIMDLITSLSLEYTHMHTYTRTFGCVYTYVHTQTLKFGYASHFRKSLLTYESPYYFRRVIDVTCDEPTVNVILES